MDNKGFEIERNIPINPILNTIQQQQQPVLYRQQAPLPTAAPLIKPFNNYLPKQQRIQVYSVDDSQINNLNRQPYGFGNALRNVRDKFLLRQNNQIPIEIQARRRSFDISRPPNENLKQNSIQAAFEQLKADYTKKRLEINYDEQIRQDMIYYPSELDFKIAAQFVKDAMDDRDINFKTNKFCLKLYELYLNRWMIYSIYLAILIHIVVLPFFEHPAVQETPFWIPNIIEFICLIIYILRWIHLQSFQDKHEFYKKKTNYIIPVAVFFIVLDLIQYIIVNSLDVDFKHRFTRPLRILFFTNLNVGEQLKRAIKSVAKIVPAVANVYLIFLISLLAFTYLIWELFRDRNLTFATGEPYMVNYGDALWVMYVSYTTANFPDVMQPAYNYNGFYVIIFLSYMILNLYLFGNMFLAAVCGSFKNNLKNELKTVLRRKRQKLELAFHLIKSRISKNNEPAVYAITYDSFNKLMKTFDPSKNDIKIKIIFKVLDFANDNCLHLNEFLYTAETLTFGITEKGERQNIFELYIPNIYKSHLSKKLKKIVKHWIFVAVFDVFILANAITIVIRENSIAWIFWSAFIIEMCLKIYTFGAMKYFSRAKHIFELLVNIGGIVTTILLEIEHEKDIFNNGTFDVSVVFRMLNLIRILGHLKIFKIIFKTLANLTPSIVTYGSMLLSVYYVYIMVGMEIFGDLIKTDSSSSSVIDCSNPKLINSAFASSWYCKNNYNNILNGLILMFELMVVNNWNVLVSGFVAVTDKWARLFFITNHAISVLISLNIFTSIVLEEFWLDCEVGGKTVQQTRMHKRIIECSLNLDADKSRQLDGVELGARREGPRKSLGAVLESYDKIDPLTDFSQNYGIKFDIKSKRHKSIEMMFQKRATDQINLARDIDIF